MSQLIRRIIFWLLVAVLLVTPIFGAVEAAHSTTNPIPHFFLYLHTLQAAFVALAAWSVIFVRSEPSLVRVALLVIVVSSYGALWVHKL